MSKLQKIFISVAGVGTVLALAIVGLYGTSVKRQVNLQAQQSSAAFVNPFATKNVKRAQISGYKAPTVTTTPSPEGASGYNSRYATPTYSVDPSCDTALCGCVRLASKINTACLKSAGDDENQKTDCWAHFGKLMEMCVQEFPPLLE